MDAALLSEVAEIALNDAVMHAASVAQEAVRNADYPAAMKALARLRIPVDQF